MNRKTFKGASLLVALLLSCGTIIAPAAYAVDLPTANQVKENTSTGQRPAATTLKIQLGAGVSGSLDVGTGNLLTSMNVNGISFAHNSLTPITTGAGTRNNWRVTGLGAGHLFAENKTILLITASGERVVFTPNPAAPGSYTAPAGKRYTLTKTAENYKLLTWDAASTTYFSLNGYPQKVVDRNGNETKLSSAQGLPTEQSGWQGPAAARNTFMIPGSAGDTIGSGTSQSSLKLSWKLDSANGRYTALTNPRGLKTTIEYDSVGRIVKVSTAGGGYTKISYDAKNRVTQIATPGTAEAPTVEAITRFDYTDGSKTLVAGANTDPKVAVAAGAHTAYTLTPSGQRIASVVDADGRVRSATYTPQMNIGSYTSGLGATAGTQTYDYGANNDNSLTQATGANGEKSNFDYSNMADNTKYSPSSSTDARGNKSVYTYAASGALATSTNALSATAEVGYNPNGTPAFALAPGNAGNPTRYEYTADALLSKVVPARGGSITAESYIYDDLGRLTSKTTRRAGVVKYTYEGNTTLVTRVASYPKGSANADAVQDTTYDKLGRVTSVTSWSGGVQTQKTNYTYSSRGEVTSQVIAQSAVGSEKAQTTTIGYKYDREGKLISKSIDGLVNTYNYTAGGTLDSVNYAEAGVKKTIKFATDDRGRRTDTWYGADGNTGAKNWEVWKHSEYDRSGNLRYERVQKTKSAPVTSDNPDGVATLSEKRYCYVPGVDPRQCPVDSKISVDKIQAMYTANPIAGTGFVTSYTYDAAGRLLTVDTPGSPEGKYEYTYDARGNKTKTVQTNGYGQVVTSADTYNAQNQVTSDNWVYDADGNLVSSDTADLVYNSVNQNVSSSLKNGSNTTKNTFVGMTQKQLMAQESSRDGTFVYTHGLSDRYGNPLIEKIRHDGAVAYVEHDPVTGNPLFLRDMDRKSVHMYISDPVDSDIRLVKDDGSSSTYKEFDPYGARDEKVTVVPRDVFDPFRYRFGLVDRGGTGRFLFGVRWYDPRQGVWVQQDSLDAPLDPVNANRYGYAGGDPVNNFDPTGKAGWTVRLEACYGICGSFGVTFDNDANAQLDLGLGVGPKATANL
ncbi:MAG: RHS repeat-associated core domain-containing protein, partial [Rothia sp. (in: high G+C Gram-positive bacteria)]|nr:RHS repeat-associated core domain-containing protein [Rothia sp. (in: high G+C Gram-positive bacteria)]